MIVRDFTADDIFQIVLAARERDLAELLAVSWASDPLDLADETATFFLSFRDAYPDRCNVKVACTPKGQPFAVFGWARVRPATASLVLFATPEISRFRKAFLRNALSEWGPVLANSGIIRVECQTLEGYKEIHGWLEILGLRREATMLNYGKQGEVFVTFSWVRA